MSDGAADWDVLADTALSWIEQTLRRVHEAQSEIAPEEKKVAFAASYCLLAAHEYLESAFLSLKAGHDYAAMACCLPVAEMAINFYWCTYDVDDFPARLKRWEQADAAVRAARGHEHAPADPAGDGHGLPDVKAMLAELDRRVGDEGRFGYLYASLYRPLRDSAHGRLAPGRYFQVEESRIVGRRRPARRPDLVWTVLTVCITLVGSIYHFFRWDVSAVKGQYRALIGAEAQPGSAP